MKPNVDAAINRSLSHGLQATDNRIRRRSLQRLSPISIDVHESLAIGGPSAISGPVSLVSTRTPALPAPAPLVAVANPAKPGVPSSGLDFKQIDQELLELDSSARDFSDQWAIFQKECPGPTTDEICLDDKRQVSVAMVANTKSRIQLIDQKISLLDVGPLDAAAQRAEDESVKKRGDLTVAQRSSQELIASLEKSLAELKHAREDR